MKKYVVNILLSLLVIVLLGIIVGIFMICNHHSKEKEKMAVIRRELVAEELHIDKKYVKLNRIFSTYLATTSKGKYEVTFNEKEMGFFTPNKPTSIDLFLEDK